MLGNDHSEIRFPESSLSRAFVVGDIHGCYDLLIQELTNVNFDYDTDILFSVGDLIDRGPDSAKCLMLVNELWFYAVRGNHEQIMYESLSLDDNQMSSLWQMNGGHWIHSDPDRDLQDFRLLIEQCWTYLPLTFTIVLPDGKKIGIVHAEPPEDWNDRFETSQERLLWSRSAIKKAGVGVMPEIKNVDHVYCGHTPMYDVVESGNVSWIDTGAVFDEGKMTIKQIW